MKNALLWFLSKRTFLDSGWKNTNWDRMDFSNFRYNSRFLKCMITQYLYTKPAQLPLSNMAALKLLELPQKSPKIYNKLLER